MKTISSRQNPTVRAFRTLATTPDPSGRRLLLDGVHQVRDARAAGASFEAIAVAASHLDSPTEEADMARALDRDGAPVFSVSGAAFPAISPVRTPSGIVAIATRTPVAPSAICRAQAFVVAAIDLQDPGNVGAVVRTAEAGGATGALVCGTSASPFSWKALRGGMGSALRLPVAAGLTTDDALQCARHAGARIVVSAPRGGLDPDEVDWTGTVMLMMGGEGAGLPDDVVNTSHARVTIPMSSPVESLNVAVAAGILIYAARRQRV